MQRLRPVPLRERAALLCPYARMGEGWPVPATLTHSSLRKHRAALSRKGRGRPRSEEHTSELQSLTNLVCRLLLAHNAKAHHRPQHHTLKHTSMTTHPSP